MQLNKRLALVGYLRQKFGVYAIHDVTSVRDYYKELHRDTEGAAYDADGVSKLCKRLQHHGRVSVPAEKLLQYDANITAHLKEINANRQLQDHIVFKYFQLLAGFYTEYYLDMSTSRKAAFLQELNAFVAEQSDKHRSKVQYSEFVEADLNRLAYWMATGSGKTLIMHLNYYQFLHYQPKMAEQPDNILLITPNAGLTHQHAKELNLSGIPNQYYLDADDGFGADPNTVKLIEITKLKDEKTGEGDSVEVDTFEGNNLVFVDEGHKGSSTEDSKWRARREKIATNGFTFEYSATFGQAMNHADASTQDAYGKAILFDYSYPRFYDDGYGKDYRILNLKKTQTFDDSQQQVYLLANLLTFFEQMHIYRREPETFYKTWNIREPLLTFIGHSVQAGRTKSSWRKDERKTVSDVQKLVLFLHRVLQNENNWTIDTIAQLLDDESGITREDGSDIFEDSFGVLRDQYANRADTLYSEMLEDIFHVSAPVSLHLSNLTSAAGEIGLRAGYSDSYFGVINIGEDSNFLSFIDENLPELTVEEPDAFEDSLFQEINTQNSHVNILIGSKKFIEGWDSWRVSCMGLMNIGVSEGPQIIQLFGRGVRLLGKDRSLKRSSKLDNIATPDNIRYLEALQIFGMRANYMEKFREYLEEEGIDTDRRVDLHLDIKLQNDFENKGLLVIRPKLRDEFQNVQQLVLEVHQDYAPAVDLTTTVQEQVSGNQVADQAAAPYSRDEQQFIGDNLLPLLDIEQIFRDAWYYRTEKGYSNLSFTSQDIAEILHNRFYKLSCDEQLLKPTSFEDIDTVEHIALSIVRKYIDSFYKQKQREWEYTQLEYQPLNTDDSNIPNNENGSPHYQLRVREAAVEDLEKEIRQLFQDEELLKKDVLKKSEGKLPRVYFDRHLYVPLLVEDKYEVIESTPPGLKKGEIELILHLKEFFEKPEAGELLNEHEVYVLRNQSRGYGVGFLLEEKRYFPDFILWIKNQNDQHICFVDPKGLQTQINVDENNKVQFYKGIKEYEKQLNSKNGRDNIFLHSFIISQTDFDVIRENNKYDTEDKYRELGLLFPRDDLSHIDWMFRRILRKN